MVEVIVASSLLLLLVFTTLAFYQMTIISYQRARIARELEENLRIAAEAVTREVWEAKAVTKCGTGKGSSNAFEIKNAEEETVKFYLGTDKHPDWFYRNANPVASQVSNWRLFYYGGNGEETSEPSQVRRVAFTFEGEYQNPSSPLYVKREISTSASLRVSP